jgi:hypothetical protein
VATDGHLRGLRPVADFYDRRGGPSGKRLSSHPTLGDGRRDLETLVLSVATGILGSRRVAGAVERIADVIERPASVA